jgi:hypothetical protein
MADSVTCNFVFQDHRAGRSTFKAAQYTIVVSYCIWKKIKGYSNPVWVRASRPSNAPPFLGQLGYSVPSFRRILERPVGVVSAGRFPRAKALGQATWLSNSRGSCQHHESKILSKGGKECPKLSYVETIKKARVCLAF